MKLTSVHLIVSRESWRLYYTYGKDVVGYCHLRLSGRCGNPAPGQDLIPLQRLHVFAHSRDPHHAIKLRCQVPFTKSKTNFQIEIYCMQCFLKSKSITRGLSAYIARWLLASWQILSSINQSTIMVIIKIKVIMKIINNDHHKQRQIIFSYYQSWSQSAIINQSSSIITMHQST